MAQTELRSFTVSFDVAFPGLTSSETVAKVANVRGVLSLAEQFASNGPYLPLSTLSDFGIKNRLCVMGAASFDTTSDTMIPLTEGPMPPALIPRSPPAVYDRGSGKIVFSPYVWCDSLPDSVGLDRTWTYAEAYAHELRHCMQSAGETIVTPFDPDPSPGGDVGAAFAAIEDAFADLCQIIRELDAYGTTFDFYIAAATVGGAHPLDDLASGARSAELEIERMEIDYTAAYILVCEKLSDLSQQALSEVEQQRVADFLKAKLIKDRHHQAAHDYVMTRIEEFKALQ